jgi:hypothetical protein
MGIYARAKHSNPLATLRYILLLDYKLKST